MLSILILVLGIAALAWLLQGWVRAWGRPHERVEIGYWSALGHLFTASVLARAVVWLLKSQDLPVRTTASLAVYVLVMTGLLVGYHKAAPTRAAIIGLGMAIVITGSAVAAVMFGVVG